MAVYYYRFYNRDTIIESELDFNRNPYYYISQIIYFDELANTESDPSIYSKQTILSRKLYKKLIQSLKMIK